MKTYRTLALAGLILTTLYSVSFGAGIAYNGLIFGKMGTIVAKMKARGQRVTLLWHDQELSFCPAFLAGHSMGGEAALDEGAKCSAAGRPVKVIVTIDPMGYPGTLYCPKGTRCVNYYNPAHVLGIGNAARAVVGAKNVVVTGYSHVQMPLVPKIISGTLAATAGL
jgi:hypothetical protein